MFFITPPVEVLAPAARHIFRREIQFSVPFPGYNFHPCFKLLIILMLLIAAIMVHELEVPLRKSFLLFGFIVTGRNLYANCCFFWNFHCALKDNFTSWWEIITNLRPSYLDWCIFIKFGVVHFVYVSVFCRDLKNQNYYLLWRG